MRNYLKLLPILVMCMVMSCASNIKTKKYVDDFNDFKTFAYAPQADLNADSNDAEIDDTIEESIIEVMTEKGFKNNKENPDLLITLTSAYDLKGYENFKNKYSSPPQTASGTGSNSPNSAATSSGSRNKLFTGDGSDDSSGRPYKKGTIVVEVFDSKTKSLVWYGVGRDFKAHIADQTLMTRMVNSVFKEFPN